VFCAQCLPNHGFAIVERFANILKECGADSNIVQSAEGCGVLRSLLFVFTNHILTCRLECWPFWSGGKCHVSSVDVLEHGVLTIISPIQNQFRGLRALKLERKQSRLLCAKFRL